MDIVRKYNLKIEIIEKLDGGNFIVKEQSKYQKYIVSQAWLDDFYEVDLSKLKKFEPKAKRNNPVGISPLIKAKVDRLDRLIGDKYKYSILESFYTSKDVVEIQRSSKRIAKHLSLEGYIFNVAIVKQEQNHAGHIELQSNDKFVNIELSDKIDNPAQILAVLSHELTHKFLFVNNVSEAITYENEVLTDIGAVYAGLGKLVLNGYETTTQHTTADGTYIERYKIGYLPLTSLVEAYLYTCYLKDVGIKEVRAGLNDDVLEILDNVCTDNVQFFGQYLKIAPDFTNIQFKEANRQKHKDQKKSKKNSATVKIIQPSFFDNIANISDRDLKIFVSGLLIFLFALFAGCSSSTQKSTSSNSISNTSKSSNSISSSSSSTSSSLASSSSSIKPSSKSVVSSKAVLLKDLKAESETSFKGMYNGIQYRLRILKMDRANDAGFRNLVDITSVFDNKVAWKGVCDDSCDFLYWDHDQEGINNVCQENLITNKNFRITGPLACMNFIIKYHYIASNYVSLIGQPSIPNSDLSNGTGTDLNFIPEKSQSY